MAPKYQDMYKEFDDCEFFEEWANEL
jgi:hypothetical protein